jgi:excinuclease ABC subunit C
MNYAEIQKKPLPDAPGVYFFLGGKREILYIGKATSLRDRVRSYFSSDIEESRGPAILKMLEEASAIDYRKTDSVLEALILEASLIRTHKPRYNTREKDDKSYNYLVITKEEYPRVLIVRGKEIDQKFSSREIKYLFGPFPQGGLFKEAIRIVRKIFPFRDTCTPFDTEQKRVRKPCFNAQIGLCPGVCDGSISKREYARMINHIRLFFEGKKGDLKRTLEREMKQYAKAREFEKAEAVKRKLFALEHINDVSLLKRDIRELPRGGGTVRVEGYDVAHISGRQMAGVMVVIENGEVKKSDYRKFRIRDIKEQNDIAALGEVLRRRFAHDEWRLPSLIVVDGGRTHIKAAEAVLAEYGYTLPVVSVVKDERHRAREILGRKASFTQRHENDVLLANSEAHRFAVGYHRKLRGLNMRP